MARSVPTADEDSVREHWMAYDIYLDLTERKKRLITEYKQRKEEQKLNKLRRIDSGVYKRLNSDLDLSDNKANKRSNSIKYSQEEREKMKKDVAEWK